MRAKRSIRHCLQQLLRPQREFTIGAVDGFDRTVVLRIGWTPSIPTNAFNYLTYLAMVFRRLRYNQHAFELRKSGQPVRVPTVVGYSLLDELHQLYR
jgi:hypothetical protein